MITRSCIIAGLLTSAPAYDQKFGAGGTMVNGSQRERQIIEGWSDAFYDEGVRREPMGPMRDEPLAAQIDGEP